MRVFVTGATGWIGSATVDELMAAGHEVTGMARSDASAQALKAKGAQVHRGDLDDLDSIRSGAADTDAVIHLAAKHDWENMAAFSAAERATVQTLGDTLAGSGRPLLMASGASGVTPGRPATEADESPFRGPDSMRGGSENLALDYVDRGVHSVILRFAPSVHGHGDPGFVGTLADIARKRKVAGYPGDGSNCWAAVHRLDAARMAVGALAKAPAGSRMHAVAETGIPTHDIATALGEALALPVTSIDLDDVDEHFGWIGVFYRMDLKATSIATQELLGWTPTGPTLLEDIRSGGYGHAS